MNNTNIDYGCVCNINTMTELGQKLSGIITVVGISPFENLKESVQLAWNNINKTKSNMINRYGIPEEYQTKKNEVWDEGLRNSLKKLVRLIGADWDGDIIYYGGKEYFVDISRDVIEYINWVPYKNKSMTQ